MCGIIGIYNKNGLTEKDVSKFTAMLERSRSRGMDATGVIAQDMLVMKAHVSSDKFVKTEKYQSFAKRIIGQKFVIGHCRQATRGNPESNENNHPIITNVGNEKIAIVHNGMVECKKWDNDPFKNDVKKEKTDTYIFLNAVNSFRTKALTDNDDFDVSVRRAFEDVHRNATRNSSVVIVFTKDYLVFCKSYLKPMAFQFIEDGDKFYFASEPGIIRLEQSMIGEMKVRIWTELEDHSILTIKVEDGTRTDAFLSTFIPPTPMRERYERVVVESDIKRTVAACNTSSLDKWTKACNISAKRLRPLLNDIRHEDAVDLCFGKEDEEDFKRITCFECFSSKTDGVNAEPMKCGFAVYCTYLDQEVDATHALKCDYFQTKLSSGTPTD